MWTVECLGPDLGGPYTIKDDAGMVRFSGLNTEAMLIGFSRALLRNDELQDKLNQIEDLCREATADDFLDNVDCPGEAYDEVFEGILALATVDLSKFERLEIPQDDEPTVSPATPEQEAH